MHNYIFFILLLSLSGCVSKTVPKNMSKIKEVTTLKQFEGCYISIPDNSHDGNSLARKLINVTYARSKKIYKVCFKVVSKKNILISGHDSKGIILGKNELSLGKEIQIQDNKLILKNNFGLPLPKYSNAGVMAAFTSEKSFYTLDIHNNLISTNSNSAVGAGLVLFFPMPLLHSSEYTYRYKRI
ncbi:MAG: Unknown protein [uncultured Sulfurovum sp.]|uniref:Uncharacterized protein n=1 Tax=uncultured Sulfurovum sp. TaxID=269237 RepID=A0A6S6TVY1_9BACT|nr:MAG: Unknown protein [uncultured Sulfurovum sp.]